LGDVWHWKKGPLTFIHGVDARPAEAKLGSKRAYFRFDGGDGNIRKGENLTESREQVIQNEKWK